MPIYTKMRAWIAGLIFQVYPLIICFHAKQLNDRTTELHFLVIFIIGQFILASLLINWKKRTESGVVDELESLIRLKVKARMLDVSEMIIATLIILSLTIWKEMSGLTALSIIGVPLIIVQAYSNIKLRPETSGSDES